MGLSWQQLSGLAVHPSVGPVALPGSSFLESIQAHIPRLLRVRLQPLTRGSKAIYLDPTDILRWRVGTAGALCGRHDPAETQQSTRAEQVIGNVIFNSFLLRFSCFGASAIMSRVDGGISVVWRQVVAIRLCWNNAAEAQVSSWRKLRCNHVHSSGHGCRRARYS